MKKILSLLISFIFFANVSVSEELSIEKQLVGIVGAINGTVKTENRTLKAGDKIYLNETIYAAENSGTQILLLDQSTFTIGSESEVVMDTFIYDPETSDGKIVASVKQGSLKVISGLISKKNPDSLTVEVPEGTLGSRGTEFQTNVSKGKTDTLLIGPGKNNTLGLRPGAVLVGNDKGQTLLNKPYSIASMSKGKAPGKAKQITKAQLKKFNKKMKALRVAKATGASKEEKKLLRKKIRKELKAQGFEKEEIKAIIKENFKKDQEQRIVLLNQSEPQTNELDVDQNIADEVEAQEIEVAEPDTPKATEEKPKATKEKKEKAKKKKGKKKKDKAKKKKGKKKKEKAKKSKGKKKKATKKKETKKKATKKSSKKTTKKKATKKKATKKKAAPKKKKATKKKATKKKAPKKKKAVKKKAPKKKKAVKKKAPKKKKVVKKKKIVKKKVAKKKKKRKKKRRKK